jgi:four helix bundle protein
MSEAGRKAGYGKFVEEMKRRSKGLALQAIRLVRTLPRDEAARVIGRQLLRSATSVGANYRAACRVRTMREFAAKLRIVCEEADETQYWTELLIEAGFVPLVHCQPFYQEATELTAIFTKSLNTTRQKLHPNHF